LEAAFDIDLLALSAVLPNVFSRSTEGHHTVPLGVIVPVAITIFSTLSGCDSKICNGGARCGRTQVRVLSKIANEDDLVDHLSAPTWMMMCAENCI
jgi:hypothetical protein